MPTVLLVEDDPTSRNLLTAYLQRMGHRVLETASAIEALHLLDEHGVPDVAVLDIVMEEMSGLELLGQLRRHTPSCADLPAILLTARHLDTDRDDAWALDAQLMFKPVGREQLSAAIARALEPVGR